MHDDALKRLWQEQRFNAPAVVPDNKQFATMRQKMKKFERTIFWRDCRESVAAIVIILWFGSAFFKQPGLMSRIGCVILVLASVFICWYPIRKKRRVPKAGPDAPITQVLQSELQYVEVQIGLLRSILWWYLLPLGVGVLVFNFGLETSLASKGNYCVFVTLLYAFIYWLNQRAVKKCFLPLKRELENTLNSAPPLPQPEPKKKAFMTNTMLLGIVLMSLGAIVFVRGRETQAPAVHYDDPVSNTLETIRVSRKIPALAVAVVLDGKIVTTNAVGFRVKDGDERVTVGDKFHIGSITKSMTATLTARLVEEGKLTWTNTVGEVFQDFQNEIHSDYRGVTLEQLLEQRSGAPGNAPRDLWLQAWKATGTPTEQRMAFVKGLLALKPEAPPGTKHIYSNQGYAIAGAMLEKKTGIAWEELMRRYLFEPLEMKSAGFGAPATAGKVDQPWGHNRLVGLKPVPPGDPHADNPAAIGPAGTVHCSIEDLAKYAAFHLAGERGEGTLLKPETFKKLHTAIPGNNDYGLGWAVLPRNWARSHALWHNGSNTMFYTVVWIAPNRNFAVVVATNAGDANGAAACNDAATEMIRKFLHESL